MSVTNGAALAAMKELGCRPEGDDACCAGTCGEHYQWFDEHGVCPFARRVASAVASHALREAAAEIEGRESRWILIPARWLRARADRMDVRP